MVKKSIVNHHTIVQRRAIIPKLKNNEIDINININVADTRGKVISNRGESKVKIRSKLTVPQLAYFFRVLHKMKKIESANQTDIIKFIAETFETENATDISFKSLRSKYYSIENKAKAATREQLMEIIRFIDNDQV